MTALLITGAGGMLGQAVVAEASTRGHQYAALDRAGLDVTDAPAVTRAVAQAAPAWVINCAAYTDVDGAESDPRGALAVNGAGAGNVARAAAAIGARLVHLSTDYVFDGRSRRPYVESDPTGPPSSYGASKLAGEREVAASGAEHVIVRTSWLFGTGGRNFVDTMLELGAQRDRLAVVSDQVGCPTWTGHLAPALLGLAEGDVAGVVHAAGAGSCSWHRLAVEIFDFQARALGLHVASGRRPGVNGVRLLVCGGAGFIGSNFVRVRIREQGDEVVVLDKLTYAGRRENLQDLAGEAGLTFIHGAIEDSASVADAIDGADAVVNFAAETHVDRSIAEPDAFVTTHAQGTYVLLEAARERGTRLLQVSTDEVYGSIEDGSFSEGSPLSPSSPYSATKAGADLLVSSYFHTYRLETAICRGSNNYGPYQHPEKLIPLMVLNALAGDPLPVYGDGMNVRNWLYVEDFARAVGQVLERGEPGEVYNVGGPDERPNLEVVRRILELCGRDESLIEYVADRPGHDRRYSLSSEKVRSLGWRPQTRFEAGLEQTVAWYRDNVWWWEPIRSGAYRDYYERQYGRSLG